MSPRVRPAIALLATVVLTAGCGSLRDEVAATVEGHDISVAEVAELASSPLVQGEGATADAPGTLAADPQRRGLAILLQDRLFIEEMDRVGGEVTDADRSQADQQLAQYQVEGEVADVLRRLLENQAAILRLGVDEQAVVDDAAIAAYFAGHRADYPAELICLEGLVTPPDGLPELRSMIEEGASFDEAIATRSDEVFPIEQSGSSTCVEPGSVTTPGLAEQVESGPLGELQEFETTGQVGQPVVILLRVSSRGATTGTEVPVVDQIRQTLEQEAQNEVQGRVGEIFADLIGRYDVVVDPRYGTFDAASPTLVAPPAVPRAPAGAEATVPAASLGG